MADNPKASDVLRPFVKDEKAKERPTVILQVLCIAGASGLFAGLAGNSPLIGLSVFFGLAAIVHAIYDR